MIAIVNQWADADDDARGTSRKEAFHPNPLVPKYFDPELMGSLVPVNNTNRD
jgi:hypothetical protein